MASPKHFLDLSAVATADLRNIIDDAIVQKPVDERESAGDDGIRRGDVDFAPTAAD